MSEILDEIYRLSQVVRRMRQPVFPRSEYYFLISHETWLQIVTDKEAICCLDPKKRTLFDIPFFHVDRLEDGVGITIVIRLHNSQIENIHNASTS